MCDDANPILANWKETNHGKIVSRIFLNLYDCKGLSEAFVRNKRREENKQEGEGQTVVVDRYIPETSTSVCFGATFGIAQFQGQEVRAGLARRFHYYVATRLGRHIYRPPARDEARFSQLANSLIPLLKLRDIRVSFDDYAAVKWEKFNRENRKELDACDELDEQKAARLSTQPAQTIKVALIFHACMWLENPNGYNINTLSLEPLELAIEHLSESMKAAEFVEGISNRAYYADRGESLLARIRTDYASSDKTWNGYLVLSKTQLTSKFCHHSGRANAMKTDTLYNRIFPLLMRKNLVVRVRCVDNPKRAYYGFKIEE